MFFKKQNFQILSFILCVLCCIGAIEAKGNTIQESEDPLRSRLSLNCTQYADGVVDLIATLRYRQDRQYYYIEDGDIAFYGFNGDEETLLGNVTTSEAGEARFPVASFQDLKPNEDSFYTFIAVFEGTDTYSGSDSDVSIKRATIRVTTDVVDSVYTIFIKTQELEGDNKSIGDQDVFVMVPRMFSNLTVFNDYSDDQGELEITFPSDIPASLDGTLEILVRIPDTDEYGNLEAKIRTDWGLERNGGDQVLAGQLWSPDPPRWMLITFVVLMGLVWGHYGIIIYKLYLIRKENNLKKT